MKKPSKADLERLVFILVGEGEVNRLALQALLQTKSDPEAFEAHFTSAVDELLGRVGSESPPVDDLLRSVMRAARDKLLGREAPRFNMH